MSVIVIHDLPDSVELDRAAMSAILGGARTRGASPRQNPARGQATLRLNPYPACRPTPPQAGADPMAHQAAHQAADDA